MSVQYYGRSMRHAILAEASGTARDALHDVVQSMSVITNMMRALLSEGEDRQHLAEGVYRLLDQQCAMLAGVYEELGAEEAERAVSDEAKGAVSHSRLPNEALNAAAHQLRTQFIDSNAKAGVDPGLISAALNLSEADVQRAIARLSGEKPPTRGRSAVA